MKIYRIAQEKEEEDDVDSTAYDLLDDGNWKQKNYEFCYPNPPYVIDTDTPLDQFELSLGNEFIAIEDTMKEAMQAASDHYQGYLEPQKRKEVTPYDKIESAFGYTDNFERAGYIMADGRLVNLNRPHIDHRAVTMDGSSGSMQEFIADGNIRISFSNGFLAISIGKQPTGSQYSQLRSLFEQVDDGMRMDFSRGLSPRELGDKGGSGYHDEIDKSYFSFEGKADVSNAIGAIVAYYRGKKPSEVARFR